MHRVIGTAVFLTIAVAAPLQPAAAQNPLGGAIVGGAAGAVVGGVVGGGKGAVVGAVIGGATGALIASQGQARAGGHRFYQGACYRERGNGSWVVVAPEYCGAPAPAAVVVAAPPPPVVVVDPLRDRMLELRGACNAGDRGACVRLGVLIGENQGRRAAWRREYPDVFFFER